jgi:hypothetical protein
MAPDLGAAAPPMSSCKAPGGGFALTIVSSLVWGADVYTIKK